MGRERVAVGLGLLVVLLVFFRHALPPDRVLSGADAIFTRPFFADVAPPGLRGPSNELLFDAVYQFTPWRRFACEELRHGRLPLWNPDSACGTPLVATMQSAVFYPPNVALCALPVARAAVWSAIVRLWIAGFATYLLLRRYDVGVAAALVSAVGYMLSGFLVVWLAHPHANVAVWLPALVLAVEDLLRAPTARGTALLALVGGVQILGGHVETSVHVFFLGGLYAVVRCGQLRCPPHRLVWAAAGVALAVGLAAIQLAPFVEWLPLSAELRHRAAAPPFDTRTWRHLLALPLFVFPNLYGNPTWHAPYRSFLPGGNYNEQVLYIGIVPFLCALVALATRPRSAVVRCWAILAVVAAGMTFWIPPLAWLNRLPGLALAHPERARLLLSFAFCVLAGVGADAVLADPDGRCTRRLRQAAAATVVAGVALAVAANLLLPRVQGRLVGWAREIATRRWGELAYNAQPLDRYVAESDRLVAHVVQAFRPTDVAMYAPALWALALLVGLAARRRAVVLVVLAAGDLVAFGDAYHPSIPRAEFYPPPPLIRPLAEDGSLHRVTALGEAMIPDVHMMYGLADVRGLDFRTAWWDDYLGLLPDRIKWIDYGVILASTTSPLLRVLNLAYVAGEDASALRDAEGLTIVAAEPSVALGRVEHVQPRSYMVYEATPVASDDEALARLRAEPAAVFRNAVLVTPAGADTPPPLGAASDVPGTDLPRTDVPSADVELLHYDARAAGWRVRTDRAGYLVTTDAWYPGWDASVDGHAVPVYRANGAFRAVYVDAGDHVVEYRFAPRSVRVGLVVSAVSGVVLAAMLGLTRRSRAP